MNLDIPNKYVYNAFLKIYLSIFVVVVVVFVALTFFVTSKDLIRDLKRL